MEFKLGAEKINFTPARVIIAGYTGRDQAEVHRHVSELAAQGIPAPDAVPVIFRATLDRLTTAEEIEVVGARTSGEAEVVLLVNGGDIWIAVGSDHTDRQVEMIDIPAAKQVCPKPVSSAVWRYADVRARWDDLILRSWVGESGREELYQEGRMAALLRPEDLLALLRERVGSLVDGAAIYTGTLPLLGGAFISKPYFAAELFDPAAGRALAVAYRTRAVES